MGRLLGVGNASAVSAAGSQIRQRLEIASERQVEPGERAVQTERSREEEAVRRAGACVHECICVSLCVRISPHLPI